MTGRRSVNIYDYPEHLNPFFEDDNHTKLRFCATTKKKSRSNSFSFQSIKDFKQSLGRSFSIRSKSKRRDASVDRPSQSIENEATYSRTTISNRQTMPTETHTVHRVSVTPLPRIRFHERIRNTEPEKTEPTKPASPIDDTNPFKDEENVKVRLTPSSLKPTTPPRKKKRAPPPPPVRQSSLTRLSVSDEFSLNKPEVEDNSKDNEINGNNPKDTENITKISNEKENTTPENITQTPENITPTSENISTSTENVDISIENSVTGTDNSNEQNADSVKREEEEQESLQINYNSELNLSSSENSVSSETRLEQRQHLNAVEDSSDLLELVQKLQLEVEKLTDDTNNNVISPNFESSKRPNFYGYDDEYLEPISPSKIKTEMTITLDANDDDDVMTGAPLSPRLVRLKKDTEWIKH